MSKLTPKEMFMVLILINIVVYYIGYLVIFTPLLNLRSSQHEKSLEAKTEYEELLELQNQEKQYAEDKVKYTKERLTYYDQTFSKAERDQIANFLGYRLRDNSLNFDGVEFEKESKKSNDETDDSFFKSYVVKLTCEGRYVNIINFIESIEDMGKSSAVQKLEITPYEDKSNKVSADTAAVAASTSDENAICKAVITFNFITVDKEDNDGDSEFEIPESFKAVSQNTGKNNLTMNSGK